MATKRDTAYELSTQGKRAVLTDQRRQLRGMIGRSAESMAQCLSEEGIENDRANQAEMRYLDSLYATALADLAADG